MDGAPAPLQGVVPRLPPDRPLVGPARAALLVALAFAAGGYVFWRISGAYRYYQDDLLQFGVAQQSGLSWELLSLNVFQHFAPANRLAHLFLVRVLDFSVVAGAGLAAGLVVLLLLSLLWLLHEVGASFAARLLSVVAVGLSITVLDTAVWADASLHILPAMIATNLVLAAHARAVTTGRGRWHVVATIAFAGGVLTQERVLFALPLAVVLDWFVLASGGSLRQRWRLLRSVLIPLAVMTVVALAAAVYIYVNYVAGDTTDRPSLGTTARTALGAFTQGLGPPWLGVRLDHLAPVPVQLAILAGVLLGAAGLVAMRRTNADALAVLGAAFVLYYGFLVFSPILIPAYIEATALRLHNGAYLMTPTVVAASRLRFRRTDGPRGERAGLPTGPALVIAALLAGFLVVMGGRFTEARWTDERSANAYLRALTSTEQTWAQPDVTLLPLLAPPSIGRDWAEYYTRHEFFLRFLKPGWVPQELGDHPMVLGADGRPRRVELVTEAELEQTGETGCRGPARTELRSETTVSGEPLYLRLTYRTDVPMEVVATSSEGLTPEAAAFGNWAVPVRPGEHTVVIPLHSTDFDGAILEWSVADAEHCVVDAAVVRPVLAVDGGGCQGIDRYGAPTGTTPCPTRQAR